MVTQGVWGQFLVRTVQIASKDEEDGHGCGRDESVVMGLG